MEIKIGIILLILSACCYLGTLAVKILDAKIPLTSTRILEYKKSYANVAEKVALNEGDALQVDEELLLAKLSNRELDEPYNNDTVLAASHDYFSKKIYGSGDKLEDYGIGDNSEVWTISSSSGVIEYRIGRHVGNGTFGEAILALPVEKSSLDDMIVIKMEEYKFITGLRQPVALENERKSGIPVVGDVGDFTRKGSVDKATHAAMPMQLLGASLDKLQTLCGGKFSLPTVAVIAIQMLERLRAMHQKQILHQDIKPQNICINRLLDSRMPRIFNCIDFGLSKKFSWDIQIGILTVNGSNIGTPVYKSRRCQRSKLQGPKDDLQSLAYSLIYMLTGNLPWYNAGTLNEMIEKKERTPLSEVCKDVPAEFRELLKYADEDPDPYMPIEYEKFISKFREILAREGLHESKVEFDWEFKIRMLYEFVDTQSVGVAYVKQTKNWLVVFAFKKFSMPTLLDEVNAARKSIRNLNMDISNFGVAKIYAERHWAQNEVVRSPEQITIHYYVKQEQNMFQEFQNLLNDVSYGLRKQLTQSLLSNVWSFVAFGFALDPKTGILFVTILISKASVVAPSFDKMVAYNSAQYTSMQLTEAARNIAVGRTITSETGFNGADDLCEYTIRIKSNSPIEALKDLKTVRGHNWGNDPDIIEFGFSIIQVESTTFDLVILGVKYYTRAKYWLKSYKLPLTISTDDRTNAVKVEEFQKHWKVDSVDAGLIEIVLHLVESNVGNQIWQVRVGWGCENDYLIVATAITMHRFHGVASSRKELPKLYQPPNVQLVLKSEAEAADSEIVKRISHRNEEISMQPFLVQQKYDGNLDNMIETMLKDTLSCPELTSLAVGCAISTNNILTAIVYPVYTYYYRAIKTINIEMRKNLSIFYKNGNLKALVLGPGFQNSGQPMLGTLNFTRIEPVEIGDIAEDKVLYSCIQKFLIEKNSNHYIEMASEKITEIGFVISQIQPNECEIFISLYQPSDIQSIEDEQDRINAER